MSSLVQSVLRFFRSTVGMKVLMALTGLGLAGFLVVHMAGNLQMLAGDKAPELMNAYAAQLKGLGPLLWVARLGLLGLFVLHIFLAIRLTALNSAARPVPYAYEDTVQASWASRIMIYTGALVLIFLLFHLAHFTLGLVQPEPFALEDAQGRHDVYSMVVAGFRVPALSIAYGLAMFVVGLHLCHGLGSLVRSLGLSNPRLQLLVQRIGIALAILIAVGFAAVPSAVLAGWAQPTPAVEGSNK
ncbi:MAG: succinate dehydrogenase cytochrome b subunit [Planctomycetota bacterium]